MPVQLPDLSNGINLEDQIRATLRDNCICIGLKSFLVALHHQYDPLEALCKFSLRSQPLTADFRRVGSEAPGLGAKCVQ